MSSTDRVKLFRKRQLKLGRKKREYYLTDPEQVLMKAKLARLRTAIADKEK
jgi:hypothetical protein